MRGRMNFPSRHPLNQTFRARVAASPQADVILAIEMNDLWRLAHTPSAIASSARTRPIYKTDSASIVTLG